MDFIEQHQGIKSEDLKPLNDMFKDLREIRNKGQAALCYEDKGRIKDVTPLHYSLSILFTLLLTFSFIFFNISLDSALIVSIVGQKVIIVQNNLYLNEI